MAVATPVFERKINTRKTEDERRYEGMSAEDLHNSRISDNYARLVNPENKIKDIVASIDVEGSHVLQPAVEVYEPAMQPAMPPAMPPVMQAAQPQAIASPAPAYFVRNARADADIFRADSPVNAPVAYMQAQPVYANSVEDESDDLRPTSTTIQYQTIGADGAAMPLNSASAMDEGEISRLAEQPRKENGFVLKRRDKVILGVIVTLILAVFALIIVNSAVISNLSADITALETLRDQAMAQYAQVAAVYEDVTSVESVLEAAQAAGIGGLGN